MLPSAMDNYFALFCWGFVASTDGLDSYSVRWFLILLCTKLCASFRCELDALRDFIRQRNQSCVS